MPLLLFGDTRLIRRWRSDDKCPLAGGKYGILIMERSTAASLIDKIHEIEDRVGEITIILREVSDDERKRYLRVLGTALADIACGIVIPLANMHPGIVDLSSPPKTQD